MGLFFEDSNPNPYIGAAAMSGGLGMIQGQLNNYYARQMASEARAENFMYNERAAQNADARTRALYEDFYSPQALMRQYKEAGLSPSLMFGGTPGQSGMSGAQGAGTAGQPTTFTPFNMVEAAQAANLMANTQKTKAETENIKQDTEIKQLQEAWQDMLNKEKSVEFELSTTFLFDEEGNTESLYELAQKSSDYNKFIDIARKKATESENTRMAQMISTEAGQKVMRQIYLSTERFEWNISTLSSEKVSADFQKQLIQAMGNSEFTKLNAEAACGWLKANIQTAELTETQKEAWNNLIDRLGKKGDTMRDVVVVLGMILNNAASNWHMPAINHTTQNNYRTTNYVQ